MTGVVAVRERQTGGCGSRDRCGLCRFRRHALGGRWLRGLIRRVRARFVRHRSRLRRGRWWNRRWWNRRRRSGGRGRRRGGSWRSRLGGGRRLGQVLVDPPAAAGRADLGCNGAIGAAEDTGGREGIHGRRSLRPTRIKAAVFADSPALPGVELSPQGVGAGHRHRTHELAAHERPSFSLRGLAIPQ